MPSNPTIYNGFDEFTDQEERGNPPYYVRCAYCLAQGPTAENPLDARDWWNDRPREWRNDQEHVCELNQGKHGRCLICDKRIIFIS